MARKGQFKKGGGRVGDSTAMVVVRKSPRKSHSRRSAAMSHTRTIVMGPPATTHHTKRKGRRKGSHHGVTLAKLAITAGVLQSVAEVNTGPAGATVYDFVQKLPGVKTFGGAATAGLYLGALGKFTGFGNRPSIGPWLKAAGACGVVLAIAKAVGQGKDFKWLGDVGHHNDMGDVGEGFDSE